MPNLIWVRLSFWSQAKRKQECGLFGPIAHCRGYRYMRLEHLYGNDLQRKTCSYILLCLKLSSHEYGYVWTVISTVRSRSVTVYRVMLRAFTFSVSCSPAQPIKVIYACLILTAWYGNTALPQCMLCINRQRTSCWFNYIQPLYKHYNEVESRSEMRTWNKAWDERKKKERKKQRTPAEVRNKDRCFTVGVYNGCAGRIT